MKVSDLFGTSKISPKRKSATLNDIAKEADEKSFDKVIHTTLDFLGDRNKLPTWAYLCDVQNYPKPVMCITNKLTGFDMKSYFFVSIGDDPKILTPETVKLDPVLVKKHLQWIGQNSNTLIKMWKQANQNAPGTWMQEKNKLIPLKESLILNEMSNFLPKDTGLDTVVWIGKVGGTHAFRVKVSNIIGKARKDGFVLSISKNPVIEDGEVKITSKQYDDVIAWMKLNYKVLTKASIRPLPSRKVRKEQEREKEKKKAGEAKVATKNVPK